MKRKFKEKIDDWKPTEYKKELIASTENILLKRKHIQANQKLAKKTDKNYKVIAKKPEIGDLMRNEKNHQVGTLIEMSDQRTIIQIGKMPFQVDLKEWIVVAKKSTKNKKNKKK